MAKKSGTKLTGGLTLCKYATVNFLFMIESSHEESDVLSPLAGSVLCLKIFIPSYMQVINSSDRSFAHKMDSAILFLLSA